MVGKNDFRFDSPSTPLVYSTAGINLDYVEHERGDLDPDVVIDDLINGLVEGAPIVCLEKSATVTGAAQTVTYTAPELSDPKVNADLVLCAVEVGLQLNDLSIPKTDINFTIRYFNAFGVQLEAMQQTITGTASVKDGTTRQYVRLLPFLRKGRYQDGGVVAFMDGKIPVFPRFLSIDPADVAALTGAVPFLTAAVQSTFFGHLSTAVAKVEIEIPAGAMTNGVGLTITAVTTGRQNDVSRLVKALDMVGAANSVASDSTDTSAKMN